MSTNAVETWRVTNDTQTWSAVDDSFGQSCYQGIQSEQTAEIVALVVARSDHGEEEPDTRTRAVLISLAPEMLEALRLYIEWCEAEEDHTKADFYQRMEMCRVAESAARAVLAKATP